MLLLKLVLALWALVPCCSDAPAAWVLNAGPGGFWWIGIRHARLVEAYSTPVDIAAAWGNGERFWFLHDKEHLDFQ